MKKILLSSFALFLGSIAFAQLPVVYYDFESNGARTNTGEAGVELAVNTGNTSFIRRGGGTLGYTAGAGALYGGNNGRSVSSTKWPVLELDPGANATDFYQFTVNTEGFKGLSLSCDLARSLTGPQSLGISYSLDGITFTPLTTTALSPSFTNFSVDLPAAADNRSAVTIRLYGFFALTALGDLLVDNVQVKASAIAGIKVLPNLDQMGLGLASGKTYTPTVNTLTITGAGTVVSLNGKLKIATALSVTDKAVLSCGVNAMLIGNGATVSIAEGCVLQIASSNTQGALKGNLGANIVAMNPQATIEYTGEAEQYVDASADLGHVVVNNNRGVYQLGDVVINGKLTLRNGTIDAKTFRLTVKGNIERTSGKIDAKNGELVFSGGSGQTVDAGVLAGTIRKLNINNAAGVKFLSDIAVHEALQLTAGNLELGNTKLTLSGGLWRNGLTETGAIDAKEGSIELNGSLSQAIPAGAFHNNKVKSLRISNSHTGGVALEGAVDITDVLDFGPVNNSTLHANGHLTLKSDAGGTARVGDLTNGGANTGNSIEGMVTVERFSPAWQSRRYRLMTVPVYNTTINEAWQEGTRWNGVGSITGNGFGTLITGQAQGTAVNANRNGFDYWSAIAGGAASVRAYVPSSSATAATWQGIPSTLAPNAFGNHEAYLVFIRGDRSVYAGTAAGAAILRGKGKLKRGSFTISVPAKQSHTLVGNPYASPLDFKLLYDANSTKMQPYFWAWQAGLGTGTGGYVLIRPVSPGSALYEAIPGNGSASATNRLIHSGEGFFVVPNAAAAADNAITVHESHKSTGTPSVSVFRQLGTDEPAKVYVNVLTTVSGSKILLDGVMVQYGEGNATSGIGKSPNATENLSVLKNGSDMIVTSGSMPGTTDTVRLRLWNTVNKEYQLEMRSRNFAAAGLTPVLVDRYLKTETPIDLNGEAMYYPFSVSSDPASKNAQRFSITYKANTTLPLSITTISAEATTGSNVAVQWRAVDETGIRTYSVERSFDGSNFTTLATLAAKAGSGDQSYFYLDSQASLLNYYRVKMTGASGEVKYSSVVKTTLQKAAESFNLYPNPVKGRTFNLQWVNKPKGNYTLTLYNIAGGAVMTTTVRHRGGSAVELITLLDTVLPGNYKLNIKHESGATEFLNMSVLK